MKTSFKLPSKTHNLHSLSAFLFFVLFSFISLCIASPVYAKISIPSNKYHIPQHSKIKTNKHKLIRLTQESTTETPLPNTDFSTVSPSTTTSQDTSTPASPSTTEPQNNSDLSGSSTNVFNNNVGNEQTSTSSITPPSTQPKSQQNVTSTSGTSSTFTNNQNTPPLNFQPTNNLNSSIYAYAGLSHTSTLFLLLLAIIFGGSGFTLVLQDLLPFPYGSHLPQNKEQSKIIKLVPNS